MKSLFPATSLVTVLVFSWVIGVRPQILEMIELSILFNSKTYCLTQLNLLQFIEVGTKQLNTITLIKGSYGILQFESKHIRTEFWQSLFLFFIGACKISVVIPTLNEEKYISNCLESLKKQNFNGHYDVIVVDGGSSDKTVKIAKSLADKIVIYKNKPVGDSRNLGAKLAESEMVAFIDADTIASRDWLGNIRESLSYRGVVGVTGPTLPYEGSALDVLAYKVATGWLQRFSMIFGLPHVAGFNCAYRREPFLRCGGFEEGRTLSEDLALSLKMRYEGQLLFSKKMIAYTSTRRVKRYGYLRLAMFYLLNDAIFSLTGKSLYYPPVR